MEVDEGESVTSLWQVTIPFHLCLLSKQVLGLLHIYFACVIPTKLPVASHMKLDQQNAQHDREEIPPHNNTNLNLRKFGAFFFQFYLQSEKQRLKSYDFYLLFCWQLIMKYKYFISEQ